MSSDKKNWAHEYILDPLNAPAPADETGPGSHFVRPEESFQKTENVTPPSTGRNPFLDNHGTAEIVESYPSPPKSSSPRSPSHRQNGSGGRGHHRKTSSLDSRFPGDMSHRPLDQLVKEKSHADRSRHITKKHHLRPDQVDLLDEAAAGGAYHHGGPYDATLFARNNSYNSSPVAAVAQSNNETLKATPRERVIDSVAGHRPLDGVAYYPPGEADVDGNVYDYEQGENMMVDLDPPGGAYRRLKGVEYHPDDIKGKGEPSYTIEKALKEAKLNEKAGDASTEGTEMKTHRRSGSGSVMANALQENGQLSRSGSLGKRLGEGLKKRIGSIKRSSRHEA